jgi:hypothetical protein
MTALQERRTRASDGRVVIKASDTPWQRSRNGKTRYFLHDYSVHDTAVRDWIVFQKDIETKEEARHTHQGGIVIYVTRGHGYTVMNGTRYDWKEGDLLVLPVMPGGVDHQHFNNTDGEETPQWVAFIYLPLYFATGAMLTQVTEQKDWQSRPVDPFGK